MATPKTVRTYTLNGTLKDFPIPFEYLARKFVVVTLIGTNRRELILNTDFRFSTPTQITTIRGSAWGTGDGYDLIEIRRFTSATDRLVDFADGSILRAYDLNTAQIQSLHIAEEARDLTADTIGVNNDGDLDARARKIVNLADGINDGDAVNLRQQKAWAGSALNQALASAASAAASEASRQASGVKATESAASASASQTSRLSSEAARDLANTYKGDSLASANASEASNVSAYKWAANQEDVVVSGGLYSSYHYSRKSMAQVALAAAQVALATTQANNSANSATASQTAKTGSEAARDTAATYATQVQYGTVPLFSVQWWGGKRSAIPAGYIPGDGQAISRATYTDVTAQVVNMMGTITDASWVADPLLRGNWATGDGSTTWRAPDLNGKSAGTIGAPFLRGDGTLSAAVAGTIQRDQLQDHAHYFYNDNSSPVTYKTTGATYAEAGGGTRGVYTSPNGGKIYPDGSRFGSAETRPLNVTGCWIIKVFGAVNNTGSIDAMQLGTDVGLLNARVATVENANLKVYASYQIGPEHINPTTAGNKIHWSTQLAMKGITYQGVSGGRGFVLPVGGVYRVNLTLLGNAGGVQTSVNIYLIRGASKILLACSYAGDPSLAITMQASYLGSFQAGDVINTEIAGGTVLNPAPGTQPYNSFIIERIDN